MNVKQNILYGTGAPQDFEELKEKIVKRIHAILKKNSEISRVTTLSAVKDTVGLNQHELVALVTVMQNSFLSNGYVSGYAIRKDMNKAGFTDIAVGIALKTLSTTKDMIMSELWKDETGDQYSVYTTTPKGDQWLIENQDKLELKIIDDVPF